MRYATINNSIVMNIVAADSADALPGKTLIKCLPTTKIGDRVKADGTLPEEIWTWSKTTLEQRRFTETDPPSSAYTTLEPPPYCVGWDEQNTCWLIDRENALKWAKAEKIAAIDARTEERIKRGFFFAGKNFSMTEAAQRNWIALSSGLANSMLAFPLAISTVDENSHVLQDAGELKAFLGAYLMYQADPRQPLGQGRVLKESVSAAATIEEVDAIVDERE